MLAKGMYRYALFSNVASQQCSTLLNSGTFRAVFCAFWEWKPSPWCLNNPKIWRKWFNWRRSHLSTTAVFLLMTSVNWLCQFLMLGSHFYSYVFIDTAHIQNETSKAKLKLQSSVVITKFAKSFKTVSL